MARPVITQGALSPTSWRDHPLPCIAMRGRKYATAAGKPDKRSLRKACGSGVRDIPAAGKMRHKKGDFVPMLCSIFTVINAQTTMKVVSLVIYEEAILSAVAGVLDVFEGANQLLKMAGREPAFKVELVSEKVKHIQLNVPALFFCYKSMEEVKNTDLIIVPAFHGQPDVVLQKNRGIVEWITEMQQLGSEVASLCLGSYFLAEAGMFNGKTCTSHWMAIPDMQQRYPRASVLSDRVITDDDGVYSSGGAFSSLNLVLYLVEKFVGRDVGIQISKMFSIDIDRMNQSHFLVFQGQRRHEDDEILRAQSYIEKNYHLPISIEQIAGQTSMSKRNFIRRFKNATHNTPLEYLQRVKIESAKKALEQNAQNISTLMYDVGYNDLKTFRSVFKKVTGLTPQEYRKKYCRQMAQA